MTDFDELRQALGRSYSEDTKEIVEKLFSDNEANFNSFITQHDLNTDQLHNLATSLVDNNFKELTKQLLEQIGKQTNLANATPINSMIVKAILEAFFSNWSYQEIHYIIPDVNHESQKAINTRVARNLFKSTNDLQSQNVSYDYLHEILLADPSRMDKSRMDKEYWSYITLAFERNKNFLANYIIYCINNKKATALTDRLLKLYSMHLSYDQRDNILRSAANSLGINGDSYDLDSILDNYGKWFIDSKALIELYFQQAPSQESLKRLSAALASPNNPKDQNLKEAFNNFNKKTKSKIAYQVTKMPWYQRATQLSTLQKNVSIDDNNKVSVLTHLLEFFLQDERVTEIDQIDEIFNKIARFDPETRSQALEKILCLDLQVPIKAIHTNNLETYIKLVQKKHRNPEQLFKHNFIELVRDNSSSNPNDVNKLIDDYKLWQNPDLLAKSCQFNQSLIVKNLRDKINKVSPQELAQAFRAVCRFVDKTDFEAFYNALNAQQQLGSLVSEVLFYTPEERPDDQSNELASYDSIYRHAPPWHRDTKGLLEYFNDNPKELEAILNEQPADSKVTETTIKRGVDWGLTQLTTTLLNHDRANTSDILDILSRNTTPSEKNMTDNACEFFANPPGRLDELLKKQPVQQKQIDKAFQALTKDLTKEDDKSKIVTAAQLSRHISAKVDKQHFEQIESDLLKDKGEDLKTALDSDQEAEDTLSAINNIAKQLFSGDKANFNSFITQYDLNTNQLHNLATSLVQHDFKELTQQLLEKIVSKQIGQQDNLTDDLINSIIVTAIEEAFVRNWSYNDIQSTMSFYFEDASTNRINILADDIDLNRNYEPQALTKLLIFVADHLQNLQPKSIDRFENTLQRLKAELQPPNNDCFYLETIFNTAKNNGAHDKDPISQVLSDPKHNLLSYIINGIEQGKTTEFMDWLIKHKSTDFTIDERHRILQAVAKKLKQPYAEKFVDFEKHYRNYEEYYLDLILNNYEKCPSAQSLIELCFKDSTNVSLTWLSWALNDARTSTKLKRLEASFHRFSPETKAKIVYKLALDRKSELNTYWYVTVTTKNKNFGDIKLCFLFDILEQVLSDNIKLGEEQLRNYLETATHYDEAIQGDLFDSTYYNKRFIETIKTICQYFDQSDFERLYYALDESLQYKLVYDYDALFSETAEHTQQLCQTPSGIREFFKENPKQLQAIQAIRDRERSLFEENCNDLNNKLNSNKEKADQSAINNIAKQLFSGDKANFNSFITQYDLNTNQLHNLTTSLVQNDFKELTQQLLEKIVSKQIGQQDNLTDDLINSIIVTAIEEAFVRNWSYNDIQSITSFYFENASTNRINILADDIDLNRNYEQQALTKLLIFVADHLQNLQQESINRFENTLQRLKDKLQLPNNDCCYLETIFNKAKNNDAHDKDPISQVLSEQKQNFLDYIIDGINQGKTTEFMDWLIKHKSTDFTIDERHRILQAVANHLRKSRARERPFNLSTERSISYEYYYLNLILANYEDCPSAQSLIGLCFQCPKDISLINLSRALNDARTPEDKRLEASFHQFSPETKAQIVYKLALDRNGEFSLYDRLGGGEPSIKNSDIGTEKISFLVDIFELVLPDNIKLGEEQLRNYLETATQYFEDIQDKLSGQNDCNEKFIETIKQIYRFFDKTNFERLYYALDESQQNKLVHDALFNESASNNKLSHCPNSRGVLEFFNNNPNKLEAILNEQPADSKVTKTTIKRWVDWGLTQLTTTLLNHDRANTSDILDILSHNTTPSEKNMTDKACEFFANPPGRLDELLTKQPVKQEQIDEAFHTLKKNLKKEDDKSKIVTAAQLSRHISAKVSNCNQKLIHWLKSEASSSMSNEEPDDVEKIAEEKNTAYTPESTGGSQRAGAEKSNRTSSRAEEPATSSNQCKRSKRQPTLSSCVTAFFCRSSGSTQADEPSYTQSSKYQR